MRIIDKTGKSKRPYLTIINAEYVGDYCLRINFNDGVSRIVDFGEFLRASPHPDVKKYLDLKNFKAFQVKYGDLMWGDFDLIFPITTLHEGGTIKYTHPKPAPALRNGRNLLKAIPHRQVQVAHHS